MSWNRLQKWRAKALYYYKLINNWMPIKMTSEEFIDNQYNETTKHIAEIGNSCSAAKDVLSGYNTEGDIYIYLQKHHSSIGTDIARRNESRCSEFLVGYYKWLADEYKPPAFLPDPKPEPEPEPEDGTGVMTGDCPRGRQYQAPLIGGCDPGYYREKTWGRDLCVCELGASAETSWDKMGDFFSGNLKMVLIVAVIAILGIVVVKMASKKVSIG